MKARIMPPDPAASRWKTMLSAFLGVIFQHPGFTAPFSRTPAFAKATADKPVRPPAPATAFTPTADS
jgi:hypothetical protein